MTEARTRSQLQEGLGASYVLERELVGRTVYYIIVAVEY
jgi:hypothetical protein